MKIPQIFLSTYQLGSDQTHSSHAFIVVNVRSARGLSLPSYVLETLSYAITLAYAFRHQYPFSTYGENLFLTFQNVVITLLIIYYAPSHLLTRQQAKMQKLIAASLFTVVTCFFLGTISLDILAFLQFTTLPLSLLSKLPQIRQNFRSQSTGQLSAFAVISQIAGCLARLFTTVTEIGDALVSAGFCLALFLNVILGAQLWLYWGQWDDAKVELEMDHKFIVYDEKPTTDVPIWQSQTFTSSVYAPTAPASTASTESATNRISTPPPRAPSSTGTRKWARKLD